ncbi:MAG TPA: substrate-binding domain-containing protein [Chthoniobacterales bacterium]
MRALPLSACCDAIEAAKEKKLRIPEDLSIIGFDDVPSSTTVDPPLTTIQQPHIEKGRAAAQMLLGLIEKHGAKKAKIFPVKLVLRQSTAAPPN